MSRIWPHTELSWTETAFVNMQGLEYLVHDSLLPCIFCSWLHRCKKHRMLFLFICSVVAPTSPVHRSTLHQVQHCTKKWIRTIAFYTTLLRWCDSTRCRVTKNQAKCMHFISDQGILYCFFLEMLYLSSPIPEKIPFILCNQVVRFDFILDKWISLCMAWGTVRKTNEPSLNYNWLMAIKGPRYSSK